MENIGLLTLLFFLAYLIRSVFGFGGTLMTLVLVTTFLGGAIFKEIVFLTLYTGMVASSTVFLTDPRSLDVRTLSKLIIFAIPGVFIGTYLLDVFPIEMLVTIFSIFLVYYSLKTLFSYSIALPLFIQNFFLFLSGGMQGLMGVGGPFAVMGTKDLFADKRNLRTTLSVYFFLLNIARALQLYFQGTFSIDHIYSYWPLFIAAGLASLVGYFLHIRITDTLFTKGIAILLLISGLKLLFF